MSLIIFQRSQVASIPIPTSLCRRWHDTCPTRACCISEAAAPFLSNRRLQLSPPKSNATELYCLYASFVRKTKEGSREDKGIFFISVGANQIHVNTHVAACFIHLIYIYMPSARCYILMCFRLT